MAAAKHVLQYLRRTYDRCLNPELVEAQGALQERMSTFALEGRAQASLCRSRLTPSDQTPPHTEKEGYYLRARPHGQRRGAP